MNRFVSVAVAASLTALTCVTFGSTAASAAPKSEDRTAAAFKTYTVDGIAIKVKTRATTHTGEETFVGASAKSHSQKELLGHRVIVYRNGHRYQSRAQFVLIPAGTYREQVSVRYRSYTVETKYRSVTKQIETPTKGGPSPDATCTVENVYPPNFSLPTGGYNNIAVADCTAPEYPQAIEVLNGSTLADVSGNAFTIGSVFTSADVIFHDYTQFTTETDQVPYTVRTYTGYGTAITPLTTLVVTPDGYVKQWSGNDDVRTLRFRTNDTWFLDYSYSCASKGSYGFFQVAYNQGSYQHIGTFGPGSANDNDGGSRIFYWTGSVELDVSSTCSWHIKVTSYTPFGSDG